MPQTLREPLFKGRTAEIFPWGEGQILKLFHPWVTAEAIQREYSISSAVHSAGIPSPGVGHVVSVNGRDGIEYQRVKGVLLSQHMRSQPWRLNHWAETLADLQLAIHQACIPIEIPSQRSTLVRKIENAVGIGPEVKQRQRSAMRHIPTLDLLCHGDFHPDNIILTADGPVIIDWNDATIGNPAADVARTTILITGYLEASKRSRIGERVILRTLHRRYLSHYFRYGGATLDEYLQWLPIVAAARLSEGIEELRSWLVEQALRTG